MPTQAGRLVLFFAPWQQLRAETRGRNPTEMKSTALKSEERRRKKGGRGGAGGGGGGTRRFYLGSSIGQICCPSQQ